ncbi:hypothetical protein C8R43DRAFT_1140023 [Mycena crocata]|nr:hypothetical protein C8R43DRAFT_1140023 [Mycena crocata]
MELDGYTAGIIVTVRVPNVGDLQVPIEKCTRGRNRVPLASTDHFHLDLQPRRRRRRHLENLRNFGRQDPSRPPRLAPKWPETLPAESDGTWLASSKLLHKRLDVHIFGGWEHRVQFRRGEKTSKFMLSTALFPPTAIPLFAVRPVRFGPDPRVGTTAQKALTMADSAASLCDIKERVVIIGPNIDGKNADFGEYAETIPEEKLDGEDLVRVRLWPSQRRETYHISSLCCSRNIPTQTPDSPEAPAIVFD